jgi:hypothetical protein
MRPVIYLSACCSAVCLILMASLAMELLAAPDAGELDARERAYQQEIVELNRQTARAEESQAPEHEQEKIRKDRREVARRFYEYTKTFARPDWLFLIRPDGPRKS